MLQLREELEGSAARLGKTHEYVLESAEGLQALLIEDGKTEEAAALTKQYGLHGGADSAA